MNSKFYKVGGGEENNTVLVSVGRNEWTLIFGYFGTEDNHYHYRKNYDHKPSKEELTDDVEELVNEMVNEKILCGLTYNNCTVWLSDANQMNFNMILQQITNGYITKDFKIKIGENEGVPVYQKFTINTFKTFMNKVSSHILDSLKWGWDYKDSFDAQKIIDDCLVYD